MLKNMWRKLRMALRGGPRFVFPETSDEYYAALLALRKQNRDRTLRLLQLEVRSAEISLVASIASIPTAKPVREATLMPFYMESLHNVNEVLSMPPVKTEEDLLQEFLRKDAARIVNERAN